MGVNGCLLEKIAVRAKPTEYEDDLKIKDNLKNEEDINKHKFVHT